MYVLFGSTGMDKISENNIINVGDAASLVGKQCNVLFEMEKYLNS